MKASIKASLLSALVFPGVGQMHLKRYIRGMIPMVLVLTGLVVLIVQATAGALQVLEKIQLQGGTVDMNAVSNLAAGSSTQGCPYSSLISLGIAVCWIYSVIDAYRLGKEKDRLNVQNQAKCAPQGRSFTSGH
jgi:TM2 domain-containing membrane protein YozV